MLNNVRVLAEDEILSHNQGEERNVSVKNQDKVSKRYVQDLEDKNIKLQVEINQLKWRLVDAGLEIARKVNQESIMWLQKS